MKSATIGNDSMNADLALTAARLLDAARNAHKDFWFGDRKVFLAAIVDVTDSVAMSVLDDCRRAGLLTFARADFVAGMDADMVADSEWDLGPAQYHFLVVR